MEIIKSVVEEVGGIMDDIIFNFIFIIDWDNYKVVNEVYVLYFFGEKFVCYCIKVELVKLDVLIEIVSVVYIG